MRKRCQLINVDVDVDEEGGFSFLCSSAAINVINGHFMTFSIAVCALHIRSIRETDSINRLGTTKNEGTQNKRVS